MNTLPVSPSVHVIEHRTYVQTKKRWIALCVVENEFGIGLKFYKWIWKDRDGGWKVDLARFSVLDIDLCQLASDALEFAKRFDVQLCWPTLKQIAGIDVSVESTPSCPSCEQDGIKEVGTIWACQNCKKTWSTHRE